ncbi:ubiquitin-conjugating enzyme/RWD-like protein [Tuber borchii]|uniref:Ubiquitin-conjugating enzyme/RWD-like protein n=1 Tax=Tuber borchii TaxID=42251 RepID=A0A2T6ZMI0_TUBBO|nr:ubiquitin-conjugating enzyme/RWD-like protein [Tuber borchii]
MGVEEQLQEIEVLQSIYPDELTQISDTSYTIRLVLEPPSIPGQDHEPPILILHVEYPPTYPDVPPTLDLTLDANSPPSSLSFPDDKNTLLSALSPTIEENLSMEMIFTLTTTLKESAEEMLNARAQEKENKREEEIRKEEEKEMEKFRGTLVTRERFIEWRDKFFAEMEENKRREKEEDEEKNKKGGSGGSAVKEKRMTGRELYEKGLVGNADDGDTEDGEVVDLSQLKVKE